MVPDDLARHASWLETSAHFESPFTKSQQGAHSAPFHLHSHYIQIARHAFKPKFITAIIHVPFYQTLKNATQIIVFNLC